jgi:hypothetical protein
MVNKPEFNSLLLKPIEGKKKRKEGRGRGGVSK